MPTFSRQLRLLLAVAWLAGCTAHRVRVESVPSGAAVKVGQRQLGTTPLERTFFWFPFRRLPARISMPGYRTVTVDLARSATIWSLPRDLLGLRWGRVVGARTRSTHQILLMRRHGHTGTWTPEDALKN